MSAFWRGEAGALVLAACGAALGAWLGEGRPWAAAAGAVLLLAAWALGHARASQAVLNWLRQETLPEPPRLPSGWAELAYRVHRRSRAEAQALELERQRQAHLLSAIEASPNGVMLLEQGDHIEWCSRRAATHLGLDAQRDVGQRVTNLVRHPQFVARLALGDDAEPALFSVGGDHWVSAQVARYGENSRLVLTQDVTTLERTEAMRRDFVANVSHEIRTPLTVVAGFVETLRDLPLQPAERERVVALMHTQTQRMQALVADLLALAQLEGSERPGSEDWWPLGAWLEECLATAKALSAGRHRFEIEPAAPLEVAGSHHELLSALSNLLSNAVRYTPDQGLIILRTQAQPNGQLQVQVHDSGIGIPREHLPRLTERFYRVDQSRSRNTGGTGLGLAIVKHVMQRHGGELEVSSELGKGSTFTLVLPSSRVRAAAPGDQEARR